MKRSTQILLLTGSHFLAGLLGFIISYQPLNDVLSGPILSPSFEVLDGDTVLNDGKALHIRGMDAPELRPWSRCWAEAALAGFAKESLERELLYEGKWKLAEMRTDNAGRNDARLVTEDGYDIADTMRVNGVAAITDAKWDWCGPISDVSSKAQLETSPHSPQVWSPSGALYDPRAAD